MVAMNPSGALAPHSSATALDVLHSWTSWHIMRGLRGDTGLLSSGKAFDDGSTLDKSLY